VVEVRETHGLFRMGRASANKKTVATGNSAPPPALGIGQLTLVEHALCPLNPRVSLVELALTLSEPEPEIEFCATPHFCLRKLGVIDQFAKRGGRQYRQFTQAIERLSLVRYRNDKFYDPLRGEHRRVSFLEPRTLICTDLR
jgi:hypothetical protein